MSIKHDLIWEYTFGYVTTRSSRSDKVCYDRMGFWSHNFHDHDRAHSAGQASIFDQLRSDVAYSEDKPTAEENGEWLSSKIAKMNLKAHSVLAFH